MTTFEIDAKDAMGRIGTLEIGDKEIETPALMPVINPHLSKPDLSEADILITNSYIIRGSDDYREKALENGLHWVLNFEGVIVTDSGSYQMSVYGEEEIDVSNRDILEFQRDIGSDVATPLDIPTSPGTSYEKTEKEWETTIERIKEAKQILSEEGDPALNAPVQGALHDDLRERAGREAYEEDLDIYPLGAVVPLMQNYRFGELVDVVMASKKGLGADAPVHLFGAGHPMVFGLAVAMGCDLFDSAAYALYAKNGRYLVPDGTLDAENLKELPCTCSICTENSAEEIADSLDLLSQHNLNVSFAEMRRVRQAVRQGDLLELVEQRCRSHPKLVNGLRRLGDYAEELERYDPSAKSTFFYLSPSSANRPEVEKHHRRLDRVDVGDEVLISTRNYRSEKEGQTVLRVRPPFGPYPSSLEHVYPLNAETPDVPDHKAIGKCLEGVRRMAEKHPDSNIVFEHPDWDHPEMRRVENAGVKTRSVANYNKEEDKDD